METAIAGISIGLTALLFAIERRAATVQAARQRFGDALGDVQRWLEVPYRVRRRASGDQARHALAAEIGSLQEALAFHSAWLQVEDKAVAAAYGALLRRAKDEVGIHIQNAWLAAPIDEDAGMNLSDFVMSVDVSEETNAYLAAVRRRTAVWRIWLWG